MEPKYSILLEGDNVSIFRDGKKPIECKMKDLWIAASFVKDMQEYFEGVDAAPIGADACSDRNIVASIRNKLNNWTFWGNYLHYAPCPGEE